MHKLECMSFVAGYVLERAGMKPGSLTFRLSILFSSADWQGSGPELLKAPALRL